MSKAPVSIAVLAAVVFVSGCVSSGNKQSGNNQGNIDVSKIKDYGTYCNDVEVKPGNNMVLALYKKTVPSFDFGSNQTLGGIMLTCFAVGYKSISSSSDTLVCMMVNFEEKQAITYQVKAGLFYDFMNGKITVDELVKNLTIKPANVNFN